MTQHRSRTERVREILDAAAAEIDENGYPGLTMDAIASRTALSKAGVYRFFSNKREVALALLREMMTHRISFDADEALGWGLPASETLFRLIFSRYDPQQQALANRVWLQIIPETLHDEGFRSLKEALSAEGEGRFAALVRALFARDAVALRPDFDERLAVAIRLGLAIMQGLAIEGLTGASFGEQSAYIRRFIDIMVDDATL